MDNLINTIENGYTVIYDTTDGVIGFISNDASAGGYPWFSARVDTDNVFNKIGKAIALKNSVLKTMRTYNGANKVRFETVRVVKMSTMYAEINDQEDKIFLEETLKKLSSDEIAVIKRHLTGDLES